MESYTTRFLRLCALAERVITAHQNNHENNRNDLIKYDLKCPCKCIQKRQKEKKVFDLTRSAKLCKALSEGVFQSLARSLCLIISGKFCWRQWHIANDLRQ